MSAPGNRGHWAPGFDYVMINSRAYGVPPEHAQLIAASPVMLAALQSAVAHVQVCYDHALKDIPEGGAVPLYLARLFDELRFMRAAIAVAGAS